MYWVFKTEPAECSIVDIEAAGTTGVIWEGVRNYQARNFLRDEIKINDLVLIHHSSCNEIGIAGIGIIVEAAFTDPSQLRADSPYYDPKSSAEKSPWIAVRVGFVERFPQIISLAQLRTIAGLEQMLLLKKGNRLSIIPTKKSEFHLVLSAAKAYIQS